MVAPDLQPHRGALLSQPGPCSATAPIGARSRYGPPPTLIGWLDRACFCCFAPGRGGRQRDGEASRFEQISLVEKQPPNAGGEGNISLSLFSYPFPSLRLSGEYHITTPFLSLAFPGGFLQFLSLIICSYLASLSPSTKVPTVPLLIFRSVLPPKPPPHPSPKNSPVHTRYQLAAPSRPHIPTISTDGSSLSFPFLSFLFFLSFLTSFLSTLLLPLPSTAPPPPIQFVRRVGCVVETLS